MTYGGEDEKMAASRGKMRRSEKDAWEWIEKVDCDAITRDHLEKAYRINATCSEKGNHRLVRVFYNLKCTIVRNIANLCIPA